MEIKNEILDHGGNDEAPWNFEARLEWASRMQRPRMIASSTARVLEVLFQGIGAHCRDIVLQEKNDPEIGTKMETIAALVERGLEITHRLRLYASDLKTDVRRVQLDALISRLVAQITKRHPAIRTTCHIQPGLPSVLCDRGQLKHALLELFSNSIAAMQAQGGLTINIHTLPPKALKKRCADQYKCEYIVISIADTGCGIYLFPSGARRRQNYPSPFLQHSE
jgi:signal transduction histidine kinase